MRRSRLSVGPPGRRAAGRHRGVGPQGCGSTVDLLPGERSTLRFSTTTTAVPANTTIPTIPTIPMPDGNIETCTFPGFRPNTPVQYVINGTRFGPFINDANGNITINVVKNGDGTYSINGRPRIRFNSQNGQNEVSVAGTTAGGQPLDQKVVFVLDADGTVVESWRPVASPWSSSPVYAVRRTAEHRSAEPQGVSGIWALDLIRGAAKGPFPAMAIAHAVRCHWIPPPDRR